MKKLMTVEEIVKFIEGMPFNKSYAAIASAVCDEGCVSIEGDSKALDGEGWWSIIKLKYADSVTLLFDYFGGGYPFAYCIDGVNGEDTVEQAVVDFLTQNASFYGAMKYVVDTQLEPVENEE